MNNRKKPQKPDFRDKRTIKRRIGDIGEGLACRFLMKQNFVIKDRNYLKKYGEIDIVATKNGIYHFIEVKTVSKNLLMHKYNVIHETFDEYRPEDNVHPWKLLRLGRTIQAYL